MSRGSQHHNDFILEVDQTDPSNVITQESFLKAVMDNTPVPILVADNNRKCIEVNKKACDVLGTTREELLQMRIDDLAAPSPDSFADIFSQLIETGSLENQKLRVKGQNGKVLQIVFTAKANIFPGMHLSTWTSVEEETQDTAIPQEQMLSARERDILQLVASGSGYKSIAKKLYLSPETVRAYSRSARLKLHARSREHAVVLALKSGQISIEDENKSQ